MHLVIFHVFDANIVALNPNFRRIKFFFCCRFVSCWCCWCCYYNFHACTRCLHGYLRNLKHVYVAMWRVCEGTTWIADCFMYLVSRVHVKLVLCVFLFTKIVSPYVLLHFIILTNFTINFNFTGVSYPRLIFLFKFVGMCLRFVRTQFKLVSFGPYSSEPIYRYVYTIVHIYIMALRA